MNLDMTNLVEQIFKNFTVSNKLARVLNESDNSQKSWGTYEALIQSEEC